MMLEERKKAISKIEEAIASFRFEGELLNWIPYGNGHINDTFKVSFTEKNYLLQRINTDTFTEPELLMRNIKLVTSHIYDKIKKEGGDTERGVLKLIPTKEKSEILYQDSNGYYWRAYDFIEDAISYDLVEKEEHFYQSAVAFGQFQSYLMDFDAEQLHETIPDFHNTPVRYQQLMEAIKNDSHHRVQYVQKEIEFVQKREEFTHLFMNYLKEGKLERKVTHNDTKLNNVLIDAETDKAVCVIDLDTVMPGLALDDFGDSIRFGASTALEDEPDLNKVDIDLNLYDRYIKGFLEGAKGSITDFEIEHFPEAAKMLTLECGIRFLTDYLQGDEYFKTTYSEHNLVRARTQFKLVQEMELKWDKMEAITKKYL